MSSIVEFIFAVVFAVPLLIVCENNNRLFKKGAIDQSEHFVIGILTFALPMPLQDWFPYAVDFLALLLVLDMLYSLIRMRRGTMPTDIIDLPGLLSKVIRRGGKPNDTADKGDNAGEPKDAFHE